MRGESEPAAADPAIEAAGKRLQETSPLERVLAFLDEYFTAPDDADIEVRIGRVQTETKTIPLVVVSINGRVHCFTADEARTIAEMAEGAMHAHPPRRGESDFLPNLILALRAGADKAEAELRSAELSSLKGK